MNDVEATGEKPRHRAKIPAIGRIEARHGKRVFSHATAETTLIVGRESNHPAPRRHGDGELAVVIAARRISNSWPEDARIGSLQIFVIGKRQISNGSQNTASGSVVDGAPANQDALAKLEIFD